MVVDFNLLGWQTDRLCLRDSRSRNKWSLQTAASPTAPGTTRRGGICSCCSAPEASRWQMLLWCSWLIFSGRINLFIWEISAKLLYYGAEVSFSDFSSDTDCFPIGILLLFELVDENESIVGAQKKLVPRRLKTVDLQSQQKYILVTRIFNIKFF